MSGMKNLFDNLSEVVAEIQADFYLDCATILHAVEKNNSGRLCKEWLPVPDPCDPSECMINVPVQFKDGGSDRRVGDEMTQVFFFATLDIPQYLPWINEQMRIEYKDCQYKIKSVTHDLEIATRLKLERVEL